MTEPTHPTHPFAQVRARLAAQVQDVLAGRYRIIRELGHGGMAVAYLAENLDFGRLVAIKVLRPDQGFEDGIVERFRTEAVAVAQLQHPHIIAIHSRGEQGEILWFEMNFIDGGSLEERLAMGPLAPSVVARYMAQAADALAYANGRGIVHRDIKPSNLLIATEGDHLVISDFGVAKIRGNTTLTKSGFAVGTLEYMSPEQIAAEKDPTSAADQYSLGVVAYRCLTGSLPYTGSAAGQFIAAQVKRSMLPLITKCPDCPADLVKLIERMLAPSPSERWQDMLVVKRAAEEIAMTGGAPSLSGAAPPIRPRPNRRRRAAAFAFGGALLAVAGSGWAVWRQRGLGAQSKSPPAHAVDQKNPVGTPTLQSPTAPDSLSRPAGQPTGAKVPETRTLIDAPSKHVPSGSVVPTESGHSAPDTASQSSPAFTQPPPAPSPVAPPSAPTTAVLSITSKLPGTFVYVNGSDKVYIVPIDKFVEITVPPGKVHLKITSNQPGCTAREDDVVLSPGEHRSISRYANCPNS